MDITFRRFGGSVPRIADHLTGAENAALALDCKLWHGELQAWREPRLEHDVSNAVRTVYTHACCWFDFLTCVDFAEGPPGCQEFYTTGDLAYPVVMTYDDCGFAKRRLGVPCADAAPAIVLGAVTAPRDVEGRSYAYQYVNTASERGTLSKATSAQMIHDGQTVVVSGWEIPDASWEVTAVRIYRSVTSHQTGREPGNILDTTWMLVGKAAIGAASFTDTLWNMELLSALEEDIAPPPPAELRGITRIASINTLVGFVGNRVYFSENNSPHQWPYYEDLDDNICGLVESNGILYVATDGHPYAISAVTDCKNAGCRQTVRLAQSFPMTGCGNRRMAAIPQGAVYPTRTGLIALSGNSAPVLLTHPLYAPDDWQKLEPSTVTPVAHEGKLFVFARGGSFVMQIPSGAENGWALDAHSNLSDRDVKDAFVTRAGNLYLHKALGVYEWDRGTALRSYVWESPEVVTPMQLNFGAARIDHKHAAAGVTITVDGKTVVNRQVLAAKVFTLPMWAAGSRWQIRLTGTATVRLFSLATSMRELGA